MVALINSEMGKPEKNSRKLPSKTYASCINSLWCSGKCLRQAFELESAGFAMLAMDGRLLRANAALCQMLGYTETELKQTGLDSLIHPEDINRGQDILHRVKTGEVSYAEYEKRYRCNDGTYLWVRQHTAVFFSESGASMFLVSQIENIDRKKQAEEAVAEKEQEYRLLVENSPDAISRYDLEGRCIYVNRQFEKLAARTSAELLGKRPDQENFSDSTYGRRFSAKIDQALNDREPIDFEISYLKTNGATLYYQVRLVPEFGLEGNLKGLLAFGTDITRHKQIELALSKKELEFRSIAENSPNMIIRYDMAGNRIYVNPQFEKLTNRPSAELLGSRPDKTGYADAEFEQRFSRNLDQVLKNKAPISFETSFGYADGRVRYDQIRLIPEFDFNGQMVGVLCFGSEQTEMKQIQLALRQNQQLLHIVMDSIPQAIFWKDTNLTYLGCNRVFAEDAGLHSPKEIVGKTDFDLAWAEQAELYRTDDRFVLDTGVPKLNYEEPQSTPTGPQWLRTSKIPMRDISGQVFAVLGTYEDITERRLAEIELERLLDKVQQSQDLLRSIVDTTPDWIFIKNKEHRYLVVNQGYANALHINADDFIGKNDLELGFPEELVKGNPEKGIRGFWADDRLVLDSGQTQVYPDDPATIDGKVHVFHTIKSPLKDANGQAWGVLAFARDITEVKKSQERLEMVTNALEQVDIPVLINDAEGRYLYVNAKACQSLRYSAGELLAMHVADVDMNMERAALKTMFSNPTLGNVEFLTRLSKYIDKSGHIFPVEVLVTLFQWQGKNFGISLVRDLSNQRQIDEMLFRAEQDFMSLVDYSPDIIVRYNHLMRCTYVNKAWETITGYSQYDMLDKTPVQNSYLPAEATQGLQMILQQVIQNRQGVQRTFVLPHALTGKAVHLLVDIMTEQGLNGDLSGIMVIARDITKQEKAVELLNKKQEILEEAQRLGHIGSWELDLVANTREWSPETYRIFELDPELTKPSNDAFMRLVHPEDRKSVDQIYSELGATYTSYEVELRLLFPDGRVKYVNERGVIQFDDNGKPHRYMGTIQDITQWKMLEKELVQSSEKALESSKMKSSFLAMMSHEIRTPLNAILGFSSLLKDSSLSPGERDEFIAMIQLGADRLTSAIDNIIELSKLVSGDIRITPEHYSPEKIIKRQFKTLGDLCIKLGKKELGLKVEIDPLLHGFNFVSDAKHIEQIINILADNAVKYTKSGEIVLGVKLSGKEQVTFYVSDTGIGIRPEKQKSIFDMFTQVDDTYQRNFEGLGIGLSAARQIVHALGGDIALVSEPGKGSVFSFTIPIELGKKGTNMEITK